VQVIGFLPGGVHHATESLVLIRRTPQSLIRAGPTSPKA